MGRGTKKPKGPAPEGWQGVADASAVQDNSGVEHDDTGPVYLEALTVEERAAAGELLGQKNVELRKVLLDHTAIRRLQNTKVKDLKKAIDKLSDEASEGVRRVKAQTSLPGTEH
jgi:hypothetical protein